MASLWPWLALAGAGALHGLNPATGWGIAAAWGVRTRDRTLALRALLPIALGHGASVALVAGAVALGVSMDRVLLQVLALVLLVALALVHLAGSKARSRWTSAPAGHAGIAVWSFMMSSAHGAGLMLVPALMPLCVAGAPGSVGAGSGALVLALAGVGVHTGAMLIVSGVIASGACRGAGYLALRRCVSKG